jgi:hypothetical protein
MDFRRVLKVFAGLDLEVSSGEMKKPDGITLFNDPNPFPTLFVGLS